MPALGLDAVNADQQRSSKLGFTREIFGERKSRLSGHRKPLKPTLLVRYIDVFLQSKCTVLWFWPSKLSKDKWIINQDKCLQLHIGVNLVGRGCEDREIVRNYLINHVVSEKSVNSDYGLSALGVSLTAPRSRAYSGARGYILAMLQSISFTSVLIRCRLLLSLSELAPAYLASPDLVSVQLRFLLM